MPRDPDRLLEFPIAAHHITGVIRSHRHGIGLLAAGESAARITTQQTAVDFIQHGSRCPAISSDSQRLRLESEQRGPQHRHGVLRPLGTGMNRGWYAPRARGQMRRGRQPEGLFKGPCIAIVGGGVCGLLKRPSGHRRLIAVECDAPQHDQPPRRQRVIELVADEQAAGEQRLRLLRLALRPECRAEGNVDPRLRVVVGRGRPPLQGLCCFVDRGAFTGEFAEDHAPAVERDHQRPHDLLRPDGVVDRWREHTSFFHHLIRIGASDADRHRARDCGRGGVPLAAAPGRHPFPRGRARCLRGKLHGQQPLGIGRRDQQRLVVGGDRFAKAAQFEMALTDNRGTGDRIDPSLGPGADAALMVTGCDLQSVRKLASGECRQRVIKALRGHRLAPRTAKTRRQHDLCCERDWRQPHDDGQQQGRDPLVMAPAETVPTRLPGCRAHGPCCNTNRPNNAGRHHAFIRCQSGRSRQILRQAGHAGSTGRNGC